MLRCMEVRVTKRLPQEVPFDIATLVFISGQRTGAVDFAVQLERAGLFSVLLNKK